MAAITWVGIIAPAGAAPASATLADSAGPFPMDGVCDMEELCLYSGFNFTGRVIDYRGGFDEDSYVGDHYVGSFESLDNSVSSIWNRSGYFYSFYTRTDQDGRELKVIAFQQLPQLPSRFNNALSSHEATGS